MSKEDAIRQRFDENERQNVGIAINALKKYSSNIRYYLQDAVAALCDIDTNEMMCDMTSYDCIRARWFYWYAYRNLTNESYRLISKRTKEYKYFKGITIAKSVSKMAFIIAENGIWAKRWAIIRRVIRAITDVSNNDSYCTGQTITINAPKNINVELKQE